MKSIEPRAIAALLSVSLVLLAGCSQIPTQRDLVAVPGDVATISEAMGLVAPGGLVLVSPGTYRESVVISTPDVTLRGTDRDGVIIDGEGLRAQGVLVVADGVTVQNLTVASHTFNGVLVTGLHDGTSAEAHGVDGYTGLDPEQYPPIQRFLIDHVTAYNNGLYGIYAFDAQNGAITSSYASGSADSGFYVGQCEQCGILVQDNVAENNAIGFENANASDSVMIVGNSFSDNRVGMTLISNYQEAFVPQRGNVVAGNLIADNTSSDSPAQADGGFGIGIGVSGGQDNLFVNNLVVGNPRAGVLITNSEDIPASGNRLEGTAFEGNGIDIANTSALRAPSIGTCVLSAATTLPEGFGGEPCDGMEGSSVKTSALPAVTAPPGVSFLRVSPPPSQPAMPGDPQAAPTALPATVTMPDPAAVPLADRDLLSERRRR